MNIVNAVAVAELAYLRRSRLTLISAALFAACLIFASLSASLYLAHETDHRRSLQAEANSIFENQPDRHPHRMVHYGHYVFRTPPPLAAIDPGLDAYGGTSMFLEGHRQNAAMFAEATEGMTLTRFGRFTPAFVLQVFAPLLLILVGYSSLTREREAGTLRAALAQGTSMRAVASGKALVLLGVVGLCLIPLAIVGFGSVLSGKDAALNVFLLILSYGLYLCIWALAVLCVGLMVRRGATSLVIMAALWLGAAVIAPRLAADIASQIAPLKTAFERNMEVAAALHALGDSHDVSDPAYESFQDRVVAQYGVASVDALPVNIKGLLAVEGERQGAEVLARFNAEDMAARETQQKWISRAGVFSPAIAAHGASQSLAGTDLAAYHRFLMAAEAHRFAFVQKLNMLQATEVDYKLDQIKSIDVQAEKATRISAKAWAELPRFEFTATPTSERLLRASPYMMSLTVWLAALIACFLWLTRRPQL